MSKKDKKRNGELKDVTETVDIKDEALEEMYKKLHYHMYEMMEKMHCQMYYMMHHMMQSMMCQCMMPMHPMQNMMPMNEMPLHLPYHMSMPMGSDCMPCLPTPYACPVEKEKVEKVEEITGEIQEEVKELAKEKMG